MPPLDASGPTVDALRARQADVAQRVTALQLAARRVAAGVLSGLHRSVFRGGSAEFAEYKEYVPGDDPRTIDWKSVARSDRWFVKRFEETTNRRCLLLLDASASMAFARGGREPKLDVARLLLAALATLLLRQGDAVGCAVLRDGRASDPLAPRARSSHLGAVLASLASVDAVGRTHLAAALDDAAAALPRRSLVVVASDLVDDPEALARALRRLAARGSEVVVLQVLDADEIAFPFEGTLRFRDPEGGADVTSEAATVADAYRRELAAFLDACDAAATGSGADLVRLTNADDPAQALLRFLARRRALARRLSA